MNEKRIQDVIEVEKQAEEMLAAASRAAEELPAKAEAEAREILERARVSAKQEAKDMLDRSAGEDESQTILAEAEKKMGEYDRLAEKNFESAVEFVLQKVIGGS
jgi:vacuolar-type H+-ATPase subunit H